MGMDEAFEIAKGVLALWKAGLSVEGKELSETDTRLKLIDPVFGDGLGWSETYIIREEPVDEGFVDYTFRKTGRNFFLLEAKRVLPNFDLPVRSDPEIVTIGGAALSDKKLQKAIRQAAGYAPNLGCPFCVVTNGYQYVIFPAIQELPLAKRKAVLLADITAPACFKMLYELLSYDAATGSALRRYFASLEEVETLTTPLSFVDNPDRELTRNRLWSVLNHLATRVLEDRPESRIEIIENCYITTRETRETDSQLRDLLARQPPRLIRESGSSAVRPFSREKTSIGHALESAIKDRKTGVYVLTGGVGSGKTTFLARFQHVVEPALVNEFCAWFKVDFLPSGKPPSGTLTGEDDIESFIFRAVRKQIGEGYANEIKTDGESLRVLFADELAPLKDTLLYGMAQDSDHARAIVNSQVHDLFHRDKAFAKAAIRRLVYLGRRPVFVLDNSDQLGEDFQERVFLLAKSMQDEFKAICIVSLRDEKFYAAYYRGVFNAFPTSKFHIGSPDLQDVLRRRLEYGLALIDKNPEEFFPAAQEAEASLKLDDCKRLLEIFIRSVTYRNRNIVRMVESVAGGNIRFGLEIFRDFVGSGNTDVTAILQTDRGRGGYVVPFHQFAKSVTLNNSEFYHAGKSSIVNVYARSAGVRSSHFTRLRLLSYMHDNQKSASAHGEGYVDIDTLREDFLGAFDNPEDLSQSLAHLVRSFLLDSEPPRVFDADAQAYKIAASGAYYLKYLAQSLAYVDLMLYDTAIADTTLARNLAAIARARDLNVRSERVQTWLHYLAEEEARELALVPPSSAFSAPLMPAIIAQINTELETLSQRRASPSTPGPSSAR
ncbi:hypothetical protein [Gemmatimonas sp.]|uniref:hypothetical protein n=1 Tax=Gemmatimonas sp. TaxID=1962908 RepID=UPI003983D16D